MFLFQFQLLIIALGVGRRSLFGDHSMHGPEGIRFYTKLKNGNSHVG